MIGIIILGILAVAVFIFLCLAGWGIGTYNTFRTGQQDVKTQWSNIKTEYQRRADLFYNLVEAVKSHKKFEKETLIAVTQARAGIFGDNVKAEKAMMKKLDGVFGKLVATFEAYPKLQSHQQHNKLMEEVRITEDRINVARTDYNEIVGDYNKLVLMFPSNVLAGMFAFKEQEFFVNEEASNAAPKIKLE